VPIEVPTAGETEKTVEAEVKKILSDLQIMRRITELESTTAKLVEDLNKLSLRDTQRPSDPLTTAVTRDLGRLADLLQIEGTQDSVTVKPRARLRDQDFKLVRETIIEHGGFWSSRQRSFVVPRNRKG